MNREFKSQPTWLDLLKLGIMWGYARKVLTSLVDPERGAQVSVNGTLSSGHLYKDVNNTVVL